MEVFSLRPLVFNIERHYRLPSKYSEENKGCHIVFGAIIHSRLLMAVVVDKIKQ